MKNRFHQTLIWKEAEALEKQGYTIEFEKYILNHCVVDIFAQKGTHKIIVECGFCCRSKERMKELAKFAEKVIHVPYVYADAWSIPWRREDPSVRAKEEFEVTMDNYRYDWSEDLRV